jgi:hypothetical protein
MSTMTEKDVLRLFLARRENYAASLLSHHRGRIYNIQMNTEHYKAVVLVSSFQFYELRYHIALTVPTLVICYEHTTVLPIPVLSLRAGNFAQPYELPETITDVEAQRFSKTGSQVLLGQYICGVKAAQSLINNYLPPTTRKRYQARAKALARRKRGKPVGVIVKDR